MEEVAESGGGGGGDVPEIELIIKVLATGGCYGGFFYF